jgi:hypothetical protein
MGDPAAGGLREPIRIPLGIDPDGGRLTGIPHPVSAMIIAVLGLATAIWPTARGAVVGGVVVGQDRPGGTEAAEA